MFDDLQRELRRLSQQRTISLSVSIPDDEDGYLDRECPNPQCAAHFKVLSSDYESMISPSSTGFCAYCRHDAPAHESWFTQEQVDYIHSVGHQQVGQRLSAAMERDAARQNALERRRPKSKFLDIGFTMQVKRDPGTVLVPPEAKRVLQQTFTCSKCEFRWASLGASFFCHSCGNNCVSTTFDTTISTVRQTIASLETLRDSLSKAMGEDTAENTVRQLKEDQFSRIVGAFEHLSHALFGSLPNSSQHIWSGNVFQRIDDSSSLWRDATGSGFDSFLSPTEIDGLKLRFQQRHVLGHGQGIVDQRYLDNSGDRTYAVGQRLIVKSEDVVSLTDLVEKLAAGLRTLLP